MLHVASPSSSIVDLPPSDSWTSFLFPSDEFGKHEHCLHGPAQARAYVESLCQPCGLRVLHLWINSSTWVPRRVEHVRFVDGQTVRRQVTVDFSVPAYAPVIKLNGQMHEMVPLALLQKKTLVNFDLRDEHGRALSLLSLRQNQAVTAAALHGVAASLPHAPWEPHHLPEHVRQLINALVFGDQNHMDHAYKMLNQDERFVQLKADDLFSLTAQRLLQSWLMVLLLPRRIDVRRIVKFGYDERLDLREREPYWDPADRSERGRQWPRFKMLKEGLGVRPVRIRFPIPGAESAQSYHLEITAPPGVEIRSGQALAARPGDEKRSTGATQGADPVVADRETGVRDTHVVGPPYDQVHGIFPSVDLHLTDVRTGSLSMAQVELRAQHGGWLTAMAAACVVNFLLLLAVAVTLWRNTDAEASAPDISLLLVFVSFASTVIAQQDPHPMVSRLLRRARLLAGTSTVCTLFAAALVALSLSNAKTGWIIVPAVISAVPAALLVLASYRSSRRAEPPSLLSPWHFAGVGDTTTGGATKIPRRPTSFEEARRSLGFDEAAIIVDSSESVRTHARWDHEMEDRISGRLRSAIHAVTRPEGDLCTNDHVTTADH